MMAAALAAMVVNVLAFNAGISEALVYRTQPISGERTVIKHLAYTPDVGCLLGLMGSVTTVCLHRQVA